MLITMNFEKKRETKGCYIFESRTGDDFVTLYLKKTQLVEAGIDPAKGLSVTIAQKELTE